jgi:hypothetical protein
MIDTVLNLLFRCSHRRITRPITPVPKTGETYLGTYVVCLDCGKQFEYDLDHMRMGKAIDHSHDAGVVPPNMPKPRKRKFRYALVAAVPAAVLLGALLKGRKMGPKDRTAPKTGSDEPDQPGV